MTGASAPLLGMLSYSGSCHADMCGVQPGGAGDLRQSDFE